jgi:peptidoglycan/LPS O-acetylase OafA/YrhL
MRDARGSLIPSLTGVRAVAAAAVFASHASTLFPGRVRGDLAGAQVQVANVLDGGALGVTLFFVLSGFVLAWTWDPSLPTRTFLWRRAARIWPVHATVWAAFVVLAVVGIVEFDSVRGTVSSLLLLQCWIPGGGVANAVNPVAWTLSCEAFFYLVFPFVIGPLARLAPARLAGAAVATFVTSSVVMTAVLEPRGVTVSTFPPYRILEFLLGVMAAIGVRRGLVRRLPPLTLPVGLFAVCAVIVDWRLPGRGVAIPLVTLSFVAIVCRLTIDELGGRSPRLGGARWIRAGALSYAFYLCQLLPLAVIHHFVTSGDWPTATVLGIAWLATTIALAVLLHDRIERPLVRLARG